LQSIHELIDPISEQWDEQLLAQSFWDVDVSLIKELPIHLDMSDIVGWHYDSKCRFSMKSAYKVHRASENRKKRVVGPGGQGVAMVMMISGKRFIRLTALLRSEISCGGLVITCWR
jgi:hypothetical protein